MAKKNVQTVVPKLRLSKAELKKYKDANVISVMRWYYKKPHWRQTDFGRGVNIGNMIVSGEKDYWEIAYVVLPHWSDEDSQEG